MRRPALRHAIAWLLVGLYGALIFHLSAKPAVPLPMWFPHQDKLFHLLEYGGLGFLLAHAVTGGAHKRRFWVAFALASVYGVSDEFHQSFVPGRDASALDWLADTTGAWVGAYLFLSSEGVLRRWQER